jgi:RimJ/RimL family protein N-acetyltransferase
MIELFRAEPIDAERLAFVSERAFHSDIHCGAPKLGGPTGYKSAAWQEKMMEVGDYYKILLEGEIVGGIIVFRKERLRCELGRIFVDPDFQNQGIGTQAFGLLWARYPFAKRWVLGTPAWNVRNQHFYKKLGFVELGDDGRGGLRYEWRLPAVGSQGGRGLIKG